MPATLLPRSPGRKPAANQLRERPNAPSHVGGILLYGGQLTRDELIEHLQERLHLAPRLRQRLVFPPFYAAHPSWEDAPEFDIQNHVDEVTLPEPGDDRVLSEFGGRIFAPMLPRDRPLWKMIVLRGRPDDTTPILWKVHHAMVDGMSIVNLALSLHELTPDAPPLPLPPAWQPRPLPDPLTLLEDAVRDRLTESVQQWTEDLFRGMRPRNTDEAVQVVTDGVGGGLEGLFQPTPPLPMNGLLTESRQLVWAEFSFAAVRRVKAILGGTVNDLVLALIAGALGRYLRHHGYRTEGLVVRTACPVNMRRPGEGGEMGNRVTSLIVPLHVGIADPVARLAAERNAMETLKRQDQAGRLYALSRLADRIPPAWQALAGQRQGDTSQPFVHTICSNVPGPQIPLYLRGRRLLSMRMYGALTGGIGMFNAIFSYDRNLAICVAVDPTLVRDPWFYVECLKESFEELRQAAAVGEVSSE